MGTGDALRLSPSLLRCQGDGQERGAQFAWHRPRQPMTRKSRSIPIPKSRKDVYEAMEIREQELIAEERDHCMFERIVTSMIAKQCAFCGAYTTNSGYHYETEKCIANIMRTRYKKMDTVPSSRKIEKDPVAAALNEQICRPISFVDGAQSPVLVSDEAFDEGVFVMDL